MSDQFEKLIRDSAPEIPDPGEYRRLNRVALRERLHEMEKPKRRHTLMVATACLALMVLFSGQVSKLGSNDWEMEREMGVNAAGEKTYIYKDTYDGSTWVTSRSPEEVLEMDQSFQAREGKLSKLTRLAYQDGECWNLYRKIIKEDESVEELPAQKPPGLECEELPNQVHFYPTYFSDILSRSRLLPPDEISHLLVFDVTFELKTWKISYPEYGEVTYSRGFPLDKVE